MVDWFDQIYAYKNNDLTEVEKAAFEAELLINPELQKAVNHYELAKEISFGIIDQEVKTIARQVENNEQKRRLLKWLGVIILVLTLVGTSYYIFQKTFKQQPLQYADVYLAPAWPISRSMETDTLSDAIRIGLNGNVQASKKMIQRTSLTDIEKQLWIAELFAKNEMADSTLTYLPDAFVGNQQRDRVHYLKILSLYSLGKTEEVKKLLKEMPDDTDAVYKGVYEKMGEE